MAKVKFDREEWRDLVDMANEDEMPDAKHVIHLLGRGKILGDFDE